MKAWGVVPCCLLALVLTGAMPAADDDNWPQWRGPMMAGVALEGEPPVEWSETKNVKWKVEIPGKGSASPIVWGDKIFVLTAVPTDKPATAEGPATSGQTGTPPAPQGAGGPGRGQGRGPRTIQPTHVQKFMILAINRRDGKTIWEKTLREELPHEGTQPTNTWASNSAVTDGKNVWAYFGSRGLFCLDMDGKLIWEKDLGDMTTKNGFGEGSSPALAKGRIVVNWDHEGESFIVALDKKTGKELWRTPRKETTSWSTPLIVEHNGKSQVITSATSLVRSYDLDTGTLIWETSGMTPNSIPSPVAANGMVYVTSGFRGNALLAIRLTDAKGDLAGSNAIVWKYDRDTPYVPSPLLYDGLLYILKSNNGILTCFNAATGEKYYGEQRLEGVANVYASPVGAGGRIYVVGRDGGAAVIERGPEFKLLATNMLDDGFDASPAVVGDEIYLRGKKYLYRISK